MAIYRLKAKNGSVGHGLAHAEYILREGKYSKGTKKEELVYKESGNMPSFGEKDPKEFWDAADVYEVNRRPYKEYEISLPNELTLEENKQIVDEFVKKIIGKDYPYTYAIHNKTNNRGEGNVHVHLMFCERKFDGIERKKELFFKRANTKNPEKGGAKKDRTWQKKEKLLKDRKLFADITNSYLEKAGLDERVSHLSLEKQMNQALAEGDIDKANLLLRDPIDISGKILQKSKKKCNKWEKKCLKEHKENKLIKHKKLEDYKKKVDLYQMEKQELIDEYKHTKIKLQEGKLDKTTLNFCSNGAYYKLINRTRNLKKEIKKAPTDLTLKSELVTTKNNLEFLKKNLKDTDKYKLKHEQLKTAYEIKLKKCIKILDVQYNVSTLDLNEIHPQEKIQEMGLNLYNKKITLNTNDYFTVQNRLEEIEINKEILTKELSDNNFIYSQAVDNISGNKFSALNMYKNYLYQKNIPKEKEELLRTETENFYDALKDSNVIVLVKNEYARLTSIKSLELKDLNKEEDILKSHLFKLKVPEQLLKDEKTVEDLIEFTAQYRMMEGERTYLESKIIKSGFETPIEKVDIKNENLAENTNINKELLDPKKLVIYSEDDKRKLKNQTKMYDLDNKKWHLNRLNKLNVDMLCLKSKIDIKEKELNKIEDRTPWYKTDNNIKSSVAFRVIPDEYDKIKKLKEVKKKLLLKSNGEQIRKLSLNTLTKGEYFKIEIGKKQINREIEKKQKLIKSLGMFKILEKKALNSQVKSLEARITRLNTKQVDISQNFSIESIQKVEYKIDKGFKNAIRSIDNKIKCSQNKIEFAKTLKTYNKYIPPMRRSYNHGLNLKKILENKKSGQGIRVSLRDKKDEDIVELER